MLWNPYFYSVLTKSKRDFSKSRLKTQKIGKPNFCNFYLKKAILESAW